MVEVYYICIRGVSAKLMFMSGSKCTTQESEVSDVVLPSSRTTGEPAHDLMREGG